MDRAAAHKLIVDILEEVLGFPPEQLGEEVDLREDLDADSLQLLEVVSLCEERFSVEIPTDDELMELRTVGDAVDLVLRYADAPT